MKKTIITAILAVSLIACKKEKTNQQTNALTVETNTASFYSDGFDELRINVKDKTGADITSSADIYIDDKKIAGNSFTTNTSKDYIVKAIVNDEASNTLKVVAAEHSVNKFTKKIVLEEFAGTWCGYCPELTRLIDGFALINKNIIPIQTHSGDPLEYIKEPEMRTRFGISSFPDIYFNRSKIWDQSAAELNTELNKKTKCGISLSSKMNGSAVNVIAKVKFDISTSVPLNIVVALVEDGIVSPQVNLYNNTPSSPFYNAGNPIQNYTHNNVMRAAATDIFGEAIPAAQQIKNNVFEKNYSFNTSAYNTANLKVVAYVFFKTNAGSKFGVLNAQVVKAGMDKGFD